MTSETPKGTETPERLPYTADNVLIVDDGHRVTAIWTPDPEQAKSPRGIDPYARDNGVEIIATLRRMYKVDGWDRSGWLIETDNCNTDFAGTRKPDALKILAATIEHHFNR